MTRYFITGGAGFIGSNLSHHLINQGEDVIVFDNLSRKGTEKNIKWLKDEHGDDFTFIKGDIRKFEEIRDAMTGDIDIVYHTAGQVAVTTSVTNPREDFEINALGTFNVLEAIRAADCDPIVIFTSTNKVYGGMEDIAVVEKDGKYVYRDYPEGIGEDRILDFHSPYGCSKGAADQYVRDYCRIYGMRTVCFRMCAQFGPRQFGNEDQGWVAHFTIATHFGKGLTIYGDGKQVRDILYVDDLINAFKLATKHIDKTAGKVFNIGGGPDNAMSLLELIAYLEKKMGRKIPTEFSDWRPGDQPVFISDIRKAKEVFNWEPQIPMYEGVDKLYQWVCDNEQLFDYA